MQEDHVRRFAWMLLADNGHLGHFDVDVLDRRLATELARELREIGCEVDVAPFASNINVDCPNFVLNEARVRARQPGR